MRVPQVDIVVPVRNEEHDLAPSIQLLVGYLRRGFPFTARVTIADNGSTDRTWAIADKLARELPEVRAVRLEQPGRGRALRAIWSQSDAEVLAYMDVDLSTDLNALLPLVAPLLSGHSDLAIGTRLARGSRVIRGPKRELISRCYNVLLHACLGARFSDAQCGFKAIRREQAQALLPLTQDTGWFFDTELLVLAERAGLRIHEVPVDWVDDLDSRVDIVATAVADLRGMVRLGSGLARGSIVVPQMRGAIPRIGPRPAPRGASVADRQLRRRRHRVDDRVRAALPAAPRVHACSGRQRAQPAGDRGRQHRRQPAADLRDQRAAARRQAPGQGAHHVRHRAGADLRLAGHCAGRPSPSRPCPGGLGPHRRQPGGDRDQVRALRGLGLWRTQARARPSGIPPKGIS